MNRIETLHGRTLLLLIAVCLVFAGLIVSASGQERTGAINGQVTDETGAVLAGVSVTVTNSATNRVLTTVTGSDGTYYARPLEPGHYKVTFQLTRFSTAEYSDVNVLVGQTIGLDAKMKVGGVETSVQVTDVAPLLDVQSTSIPHNVTEEEFDRLPKGRSFQGMLNTSPSVMTGQDQFGNVV